MLAEILQNDIFVPNMGAVKTKPNYKFEPEKNLHNESNSDKIYSCKTCSDMDLLWMEKSFKVHTQLKPK